MTKEEFEKEFSRLKEDFSEVICSVNEMWHEDTVYLVFYNFLGQKLQREGQEYWPEMFSPIWNAWFRSQCIRIRALNESRYKNREKVPKDNPPQSLRRILEELEELIEKVKSKEADFFTRGFYFEREGLLSAEDAQKRQDDRKKEEWDASGRPWRIVNLDRQSCPENSDLLNSVIDKICEFKDSSNRSPDDKVNLEILMRKIKSEKEALDKVTEFTDNNIAHMGVNAPKSLTWDPVTKSCELMYKVAKFVQMVLKPMDPFMGVWVSFPSRDDIEQFKLLGVEDEVMIRGIIKSEYEKATGVV